MVFTSILASGQGEMLNFLHGFSDGFPGTKVCKTLNFQQADKQCNDGHNACVSVIKLQLGLPAE